MPSARPLRTTGLWLLLGGLVLFSGVWWEAYVRQSPIVEAGNTVDAELRQTRDARGKEGDNSRWRYLDAQVDRLRNEETLLWNRLQAERDRARYRAKLTAPLWIGCPMIGLGLIGWDAWRRRGQRRGGIKA